MRSRFRCAVLAVVMVTLGCQGLTGPSLPADAERFVPPPVYARWWALTEECSGIRRPLSDVQFFRVPNAETVPAGKHGDVAGYWSSPSNRIVLAGRLVDDGRVVRHEMLHALIQATGHPPAYFQGRCGGVVSCHERGCQDAGPAPVLAADDAPTLPLAVVGTQIEVLPNRVSRSGTDRALTMVVRLTNPTAVPVWVPLESWPEIREPLVAWHGFRLFVGPTVPVPTRDLMRNDSLGFFTIDFQNRIPFAAGQTRVWVIDMSADWYPAGDYTAVGFFNARQVWTTLTVDP